MSESCEIPLHSASTSQIQQILTEAHTIAVVGLSDKPDRDSYRVAAYLQQQGYRIIPVNPSIEQVLGEKAYPTVQAIPGPIDVVDIFRKPEAVPAIVDEAIAKRIKTIWMQEGIVHNAAADKARAAGIQVVMSRCIMVEHRLLQNRNKPIA